MRILFVAFVAAAVAAFLIVSGVFRPPPAATRLAGVSVAVQDVAVDDLPPGRAGRQPWGGRTRGKPSGPHTLVWGIPGGRCGLVMEAFGVCVVESAGTVDVELPHTSLMPSIGPIGPLFPFGSPSPR